MRNLILFLIITAFLASCRSPEKMCSKAQIKYERAAYRWGCPLVVQSDTVYTQMIIRERHDTTIFVRVPADTVRSVDTVLIRDGLVESDKSRLDTKYAFSVAYVYDSRLYHNLFQKESVIASTIKDAIQSNSRIEEKYITNTVTTNVLTGWQWFQIWAGRLLAGLLLIALIIFGLRRWFRLY
jgi:hypothetical protein